MEKEIKNVAKNSLIITVILIISKMTGFLREFIVAIQLGATAESDVFKTASTMPQVFFSAIAAALVTTFIPIFSGIKNNKQEAVRFFNNVLNIIVILCTVLAVIAIFVSPQLVKLFAGGFKEDYYKITVNLTRVLMPSIIFLGISGLYTGYLQSYGNFIQPALTGIVANVVIMVGLIVFYKYFGLYAAIMSVFLGAVAQAYSQRPFMGKDYKYQFILDFKDKNVRKMMLLAIPILISSAVSQINLMVARNFASYLVEGSISVIDYASKFSTIINQVFIVSITTVIYPKLTEKNAQGDIRGFNDIVVKSVNIVLLVTIPLVFGLFSLSEPLIRLILEHGKFDRNATIVTSYCLKYLVFSAIGYSLIDILGKVFFAMKNTLTPMINGFILVVVNIAFIYLLGPVLKVNGIALATTLSVNILALILLIEVKIKIKSIKYKKIIITSSKMLISGIIMTIAVNLTYSFIKSILQDSNLNIFINMLISSLVGAFVYIVMLIILNVEDLFDLIKFKNKKG
ncbi:murein biosynthesis integral membrane protein MurJ [Thermobrachium celere]|uniref:Probable lipid II flippase MurJ n=1 Tax=Thermobrachium celere DSM 8682 TaxID=941824 RepID=R7RNW0_9CLOT|nr:murein biosynthesis integral membrane protein MurJ [Thermobrachium celere]CDF57739.1 Virulence factor MVIN-like [Thermobrachium celere DSM 8682]